jgi:hypothetical protein
LHLHQFDKINDQLLGDVFELQKLKLTEERNGFNQGIFIFLSLTLRKQFNNVFYFPTLLSAYAAF